MLLMHVKKIEIKELILASSSEVYQKANIIPTPENAPFNIPDVFNPRYSYATGKILSEVIAMFIFLFKNFL